MKKGCERENSYCTKSIDDYFFDYILNFSCSLQIDVYYSFRQIKQRKRSGTKVQV